WSARSLVTTTLISRAGVVLLPMPERAPDPRVPVPRHRVTTLRPYKRARRDRVWGALGLVFLLVTLYLLFGGWKAPVVRPHGYSVRWEESVHALANVSADLHWTY